MKRRYIVGTVMAISSLLLFLTIHRPGGALAVSSSQTGKSTEMPVVDYDKEVVRAKTKPRKDRDSRFNGRGAPGQKPIAELPEGVEPLPSNSHIWDGLAALPVDKSDIIVLGNIVGSEAHLSADKTGIYSEFTVQANEIFKDNTSSVTPGASLSVIRLGGSVRFPSGKIQYYSISGQGAPRVGAQYVLFLRKTTGGDLMILTGYELSREHVTPLDGVNSKGSLPFEAYLGADQAEFLQKVREAAASVAAGERKQ